MSARGDEKQSRLHTVQLDGLVLLKIIKHCKDNAPDLVTGQLLGLELDGRLEVTNSFPFPQSESDEENDAYQLAMMKQLRTHNVDNNTVGWYQSAYFGNFLSQSLLDGQYQYQKTIPTSVVLVYDPTLTTNGHLQLTAYRLTDEFMRAYEQSTGKLGGRSLAQLDPEEILEQIPLKVHNSHLVHAFLYELRESKTMSCDLDRLPIDPAPYMERTLVTLTQCVDDYSREQYNLQNHLRAVARQKQDIKRYKERRSEENQQRVARGLDPLPEEDLNKIFKPIPTPSPLEGMMLSRQIEHYSREVLSTATQAINKLYVVEALHKPTTSTSSTAAVAAMGGAAALPR